MSVPFIQSELNNNQKSSSSYRKSYAVCIGIDNYQNTSQLPLSNAVNDAVGISNLLSSFGFEVFNLLDNEATKDKIMTLIIDILPKFITCDEFDNSCAR